MLGGSTQHTLIHLSFCNIFIATMKLEAKFKRKIKASGARWTSAGSKKTNAQAIGREQRWLLLELMNFETYASLLVTHFVLLPGHPLRIAPWSPIISFRLARP